MTRYASHVSTKETHQTEPIPGKAMILNHAGGFSFALDDWKRLDRFLVLGATEGTYYVGEKELTVENAMCIESCIASDGVRTVRRIVEISDAGRAPKNDPAIFALALCIAKGNKATRDEALASINKVCRIGTHIFQFVGCLKQLTKWNRSLRRAVANWYLLRKPENLALQVVKYQNRNGFTHRDVLRLSHPKAPSGFKEVLAYAAGKHVINVKDDSESKNGDKLIDRSKYNIGVLPDIILAHEQAKTADVKTLCRLIRDKGLPRECVPTEYLKTPAVWEALLEDMPLTAMIRNLGNLSKCGLLVPLSAASRKVTSALADIEKLKASRVHPVALLLALKTYGSGHGVIGKSEWNTVPAVVDALDAAFYKAFDFVEPTGKRFLIGVDVSGSMSSAITCAPVLTCAEGAAALAMTIAKTESEFYCHGFSGDFVDLGITPRMRLDDILTRTDDMNFGATDCAVPMTYAMEHKLLVDTFVVLTDSETYHGSSHPSQALNNYRNKFGIAAKLIVVGMTATDITIADPHDAGMLDVAGFDAGLPTIISDFVKE